MGFYKMFDILLQEKKGSDKYKFGLQLVLMHACSQACLLEECCSYFYCFYCMWVWCAGGRVDG